MYMLGRKAGVQFRTYHCLNHIHSLLSHPLHCSFDVHCILSFHLVQSDVQSNEGTCSSHTSTAWWDTQQESEEGSRMSGCWIEGLMQSRHTCSAPRWAHQRPWHPWHGTACGSGRWGTWGHRNLASQWRGSDPKYRSLMDHLSARGEHIQGDHCHENIYMTLYFFFDLLITTQSSSPAPLQTLALRSPHGTWGRGSLSETYHCWRYHQETLNSSPHFCAAEIKSPLCMCVHVHKSMCTHTPCLPLQSWLAWPPCLLSGPKSSARSHPQSQEQEL